MRPARRWSTVIPRTWSRRPQGGPKPTPVCVPTQRHSSATVRAPSVPARAAHGALENSTASGQAPSTAPKDGRRHRLDRSHPVVTLRRVRRRATSTCRTPLVPGGLQPEQGSPAHGSRPGGGGCVRGRRRWPRPAGPRRTPRACRRARRSRGERPRAVVEVDAEHTRRGGVVDESPGAVDAVALTSPTIVLEMVRSPSGGRRRTTGRDRCGRPSSPVRSPRPAPGADGQAMRRTLRHVRARAAGALSPRSAAAQSSRP